MSHVSRPIKRGQIFGNMAPRKPQLSRHFKNLEFIFNIHEFEVYYWVSFAKQNGVEMQGKNFQMTVGMCDKSNMFVPQKVRFCTVVVKILPISS